MQNFTDSFVIYSCILVNWCHVFLCQVETDEELVLPSQEAIPYSWRSTRARQLLRIMLHNQQPASSTTAGASTVASSNEVDIHDESIFCISLTTANGQESAATLVIKILKLSSTIKQVQ